MFFQVFFLSRFSWLFALIIIFLFLSSCLSSSTLTNKNRQLQFEQPLLLNNIPLQAVIFQTKKERKMGLMQIAKMPNGKAALFIYPRPSSVNFWMKNTLISLDILYFDKDKKLIGIIKKAAPCTISPCLVYPANNIQYVIELNAGFVDQYQIQLGAIFTLNME